jgi:DNA mismatch endonuclease, patch repair protein
LDTVDKETRSRVMAAVHSENTKLEQALIALLNSAEVRGFICHDQSLPGKPDIVFREEKIVVFLDSCFWHGCPKHLRQPSSNQAYWQSKIEKNMKRDRRTRATLRRMGWSVLRVWEHDLKNPTNVVKKVRRTLEKRM